MAPGKRQGASGWEAGAHPLHLPLPPLSGSPLPRRALHPGLGPGLGCGQQDLPGKWAPTLQPVDTPMGGACPRGGGVFSGLTVCVDSQLLCPGASPVCLSIKWAYQEKGGAAPQSCQGVGDRALKDRPQPVCAGWMGIPVLSQAPPPSVTPKDITDSPQLIHVDPGTCPIWQAPRQACGGAPGTPCSCVHWPRAGRVLPGCLSLALLPSPGWESGLLWALGPRRSSPLPSSCCRGRGAGPRRRGTNFSSTPQREGVKIHRTANVTL